ncbi:hypothetical protein FACS1894200_00760 [Spirochaetia bacterium]|nr:hypothetical protein FACS1894200_00760 [Spirochaetia bacterium]
MPIWSRLFSHFLFALFVLLIGVVCPVLGQEEWDEDEEPPPTEESPQVDWDDYMSTFYAPGDQTFFINLGITIPTVFYGKEGKLDHNLTLGGTGFLAYQYYNTAHVFIGGEIGGMFCGTKAGNMLFMVPMGLRLGYQFVVGRFEFPVSLLGGAIFQKYLEKNFFGLFVKPMASVFYRFSPDWSFGLNAAWWFVPEWTGNKDENVYGNFLELTLSAAYHF